MIQSQLADVLKKRGLERISAKIGEQIDLSTSEAVGEIDPPADGDSPPGTVLEEIGPGWKLNDKILRPVRVKTAKKQKIE